MMWPSPPLFFSSQASCVIDLSQPERLRLLISLLTSMANPRVDRKPVSTSSPIPELTRRRGHPCCQFNVGELEPLWLHQDTIVIPYR